LKKESYLLSNVHVLLTSIYMVHILERR